MVFVISDLLIYCPLSSYSTINQVSTSFIIVFTKLSWFCVKKIGKIPDVALHEETKAQQV